MMIIRIFLLEFISFFFFFKDEPLANLLEQKWNENKTNVLLSIGHWHCWRHDSEAAFWKSVHKRGRRCGNIQQATGR